MFSEAIYICNQFTDDTYLPHVVCTIFAFAHCLIVVKQKIEMPVYYISDGMLEKTFTGFTKNEQLTA